MKELVNDIKLISKNLSKILKLFSEYSKTKENFTDNAYLADKTLREIYKTIESLPSFPVKTSLLSWFDDEKEILEKAKEDFRFSFGKTLNELFLKDGKKVRGQYPTLRVGMYTIKLNFEFGEASLYFGPEVEKVKGKIPLNPKYIYDAVKKSDDELKSRKFEIKQFLNGLFEAYKRRLLLDKKVMGVKLGIIDVLNEFVIIEQPQKFTIDPRRENFQEYPRIKLSYFLYLLRKSSEVKSNMRFYVANFSSTSDKKSSIWIPDNEDGEGTYFAYVSFEEGDRKTLF